MKKNINNALHQKIKTVQKKEDPNERSEVTSDSLFKIMLTRKLNLLLMGESV
jgi:hypothetical protein